MNRGSLHTRSFKRIHFSVFRYRWAENGFTGPKTFRGFRETGPWWRDFGTVFACQVLLTKIDQRGAQKTDSSSTLGSGKFENAALFLRLGLSSILIRHENWAFRKRSSNRRNLKTTALAFRFRVRGKHQVLKMELCGNDLITYDYH